MTELTQDEKIKKEREELEIKLCFTKKCGWDGLSEKELKEIMALSEDYKQFLNTSKTEREAIHTIAAQAAAEGYVPVEKATDKDRKLFLNFDGVSGALVYINDPLKFAEGFLMNGAHIDVPRLDLKPNPLYEAEDMAYMKTHYYGGIKKYQWVTRPLALHGVVVLETGRTINIVIGEDESDPVFTINDLLPHLSKDQNEKTAGKLIEGEQLNILVGSIPYKFKSASNNAVKLWILNELFEKYGIKEQDFVSAEIQLVPAGSARDVGFDRSFIGAHGHDDRICSYIGMRALFDIESESTTKNLMMVFFDKEEIGSKGNAGADSNLIERMVSQILKVYGIKDYHTLMHSLANSKFLSSDVNAGIDPEWKSVTEPMNAAKMGHGVAITKYTGVRGKSGSNEAHAEFVAEVRYALNKDNVLWQPAELGKVDQGGGGTVAYMLAAYGMDVLDCGPALLSMHSPFEVASKVDIFHTYKAYKAFYKYL